MATCNDNYLLLYREFFEKFAANINPHDQLPVKLASYKLNNDEIAGVAADWTQQYLNQQHCPVSLLATLTKIVVDEIKHTCKSQHQAYGFNSDLNVYEPLKLMKAVMGKVNEVCLRYLDNSELYNLSKYSSLQKPYDLPLVSAFAIKNTRRQMEDRHVFISDLNTVFGVEDPNGPSSYYAIFDGHAGIEAAAYSAVHLHQYLAESIYYPQQPERALREAFIRTDAAFIDKAQKENLNGGTTAVCALLRPKQYKLYIAWVGDSMALLANHGSILQVVQPHRPSRMDEKERITEMGGHVSVWSGGIWRVDGTLAISRAIGDAKYKPYVTGDPDIVAVPLNGGEDFLILATDGLWDCVDEDQAAAFVYRQIFDNPDDTARISKNLVQLAKDQGSSDNISIIVVFLRDPHQIASTPLPQNIASWHNNLQTPDTTNRNGGDNTNIDTKECIDNKMDLELEQSLDNSNKNAFSLINNSNQKTTTDLLLDRIGDDAFNNKQNGTSNDESPSNEENLYYDNAQPTNGKRSADEFEDDEDHSDDFGPETDVDGIDHVAISPSLNAAKEISDGHVNNNAFVDDEKMMQSESDQEDEELSDELVQRNLSMPQSDNLYDDHFEKDEERLEATENINVHHERPEFDTGLDTSRSAPTENVTESGGEESDDEDEWNYYRGGKTNQTEVEDPQLVTGEDDDSMSQLNPDAAEFVPISSARSTPLSPPICENIKEEDKLIAQSPQKPTPMEQNIPNPIDFLSELRERPGHLEDDFVSVESKAKDDNLECHQIESSSAQQLETILNGKNVDELEFQPKIISDFESGDIQQNISNETDNMLVDFSKDTETSETESSHQNMDEFYSREAAENTSFSTNPFDLNSVQMIPDNIDEFIGETGDEDKENKKDVDAVIDEVEAIVEQEIKLMGSTKETDEEILEQKIKSMNIEEKEQESPVDDKLNDFEGASEANVQDSKSPVPDNDAVLHQNPFDVQETAPTTFTGENPFITDTTEIKKDTELSSLEATFEIIEPTHEDLGMPETDFNESSALSPAPASDAAQDLKSSPQTLSPVPDSTSPLPPDHASQPDSTAPIHDNISQPDSTSPLPDHAASPLPDHSTSSLPDHGISPLPDQAASPLPDHVASPLSDHAASPLPDQATSPFPDQATSPLPDQATSPLPDQATSPLPDQATSPLPDQATSPLPDQATSPLPDQTTSLLPDQATSPLPDHVSHPDSTSPLPADHISQPDSTSPPPEYTAQPDSVSPLPEHVDHPDFISPTPDSKLQLSENNYPEIPLANEFVDQKSETQIEETFSQTILPETTAPKEDSEPILEPNVESNTFEPTERIVCPLKPEESEPVAQEHIPTFEAHVEEFEKQATTELFQQEMSSPLSEKAPSPCFEKVGSPIPTDQREQSQQEQNLAEVAETNFFSIDTTVAESNLNSFLSRSPVAEVPISPLQRTEPSEQENEQIPKPEDLEPEVKSTGTPPPTPSVTLPEAVSPKPEPNQLVEAVEKLTEKTVKDKTPVTETAKKTKVQTTTKATPKPSSPSKTTTAATKRPTPVSSRLTTKTSTTSTTSPKPSPTTRPTSRPTTTVTTKTTTSTLTSRRPVSSTETKPATKSTTTTTKRVSATSTTAATAALKSTLDKNKLNQTPSPRPITSPRKTPITRPPLGKDTTEKSRPVNLSAKSTTTNGLSSKVSPSLTKTATTTTSRLSSTSTARPKSAPTTMSSTAARPRPPITRKPLTADTTKSSLTEKQMKETANKQLSGSRTTSTAPSNRTNFSNVKSRISTTTTTTSNATNKKVETKSPIKSTRVTTTTTTSVMKPKKPTVTATRTTITKTAVKTTEQNQTVSLIQELTNVSVVSTNEQLVKDESPNIEPLAPQLLDNNLVSVE